MKHILALPSWGLICIPMEQEAFTFPNMEVGHPAHDIARTLSRIHVHLRSFGGHGTNILVNSIHQNQESGSGIRIRDPVT